MKLASLDETSRPDTSTTGGGVKEVVGRISRCVLSCELMFVDKRPSHDVVSPASHRSPLCHLVTALRPLTLYH